MFAKIKDKIFAFMVKYSVQIHFIVVGWMAFVSSWATGLPLPLHDLGIPLDINARTIVVWAQAHAHIPTALIGVLTFAINLTVAYVDWRKKKIKKEEKIAVAEVKALQSANISVIVPDTSGNLQKS